MSLSVTILKLDGVVFPGDSFRCAIEFKNTRPASSEDSPHHIETLAWASAQIYGQYIVDPGLIKLPASTIQRSLAGSTLPKLGMRTFSIANFARSLCPHHYSNSDHHAL
jgi:hypothetical protein